MKEHLRVSPEIRKFSSAISYVEVNGYRTLEKKILEVNGEDQTWHLVKGGDTKCAVYFNPDKREWLKTTPPVETNYKMTLDMLENGAKIVRTALGMSGLENHAKQVEECMIRTDKNYIFGHKTPHIGPTVEYLNKQISNTDIDFNKNKYLAGVYIEGFNLAAQLYTRHGIWTADPNEGNIVLNFDNPDDVKVTLIDFEKLPQYKDVNEEGFFSLFELFEKKAAKSGIVISRDHEDVVNPAVLFSERKKRYEGT